MRSANRVRPLVDHQLPVGLLGTFLELRQLVNVDCLACFGFFLLHDLADIQCRDDSTQVIILAHALGMQDR